MRLFPLMCSDIDGIPWDMLQPHEAQAQKNHDQSLETLAGRGGLSPCEALAILDDNGYYDAPYWKRKTQENEDELVRRVRVWKQTRITNCYTDPTETS